MIDKLNSRQLGIFTENELVAFTEAVKAARELDKDNSNKRAMYDLINAVEELDVYRSLFYAAGIQWGQTP